MMVRQRRPADRRRSTIAIDYVAPIQGFFVSLEI
jgi:hypothetical protein